MPQSQPRPPVARRSSHTFTHHGVTVEDAYAWLKDPQYPAVSDPEILAYLEAENTYYDATMAPLQDQVDILFQEMKARQPQTDASVPYRKNGYWYQWRFYDGAQYRTWYRLADQSANLVPPTSEAEPWEVILDEPALAAGHDYFCLGGLSVSPDGRALAYSTDTDGSERFTLHVIDLETGKTLHTPIADTIDAPVWNAQSSGLIYVEVSDAWRPYRVWFVALDEHQPQLLYEEADTSFFVHTSLTQSEHYIVIATGGHTHNENYLLARNNASAAPVLVSPRAPNHEYHLDHRVGEFVIRSNLQHTNFDLFRAPESSPGQGHWEKILPGDPHTYVLDHLCLDKAIVAELRVDGLDQVRIMECRAQADPRDCRTHDVAFPEAAYAAGLGTNPNADSTAVRLSYTSLVTPNTVYDYSIAERTLHTRKVQVIPAGYAGENFQSTRLMAMGRDGTDIPISLVHHKNTPLDGSAPLYLYGYGAYGHAIPPTFSSTRLSLLERGFIFAIAHIRGGDELGYHWYTAGKLDKRTNTFNDFVDCARHLIAQDFVQAGKIAIAGGSAGGELMGAVVNQAPDLWGAVAAHVPFVDVLNTMLDADLPLTPLEWPEWGNPLEDAEAFELIRSYSPYDQLKAGAYPPMLVTAGLNDPRVTYWEPAKYVARLRHLKTDDNALVFKTNMGAGHGGKSGRFDALRETAEEYAFILAILGSP